MAWSTPKENWTAVDGVAYTDLNAIGANLTYLKDNMMPLAGGTFTGKAYAQANTDYTTAQTRNIALWDGTGGTPTTGNGDVLITYTP